MFHIWSDSHEMLIMGHALQDGKSFSTKESTLVTICSRRDSMYTESHFPVCTLHAQAELCTLFSWSSGAPQCTLYSVLCTPRKRESDCIEGYITTP